MPFGNPCSLSSTDFCQEWSVFLFYCRTIIQQKMKMSKVEVSYISEMELITVVWHPAKKTLIRGPSFPSSFQDLHADSFCLISLNKTHLIIMGHQLEYYSYNAYRYKVAIINFQTQKWFYLTNFYLDFYLGTCKGALGFEKHGKRLVIHFFFIYYSNFKFRIINFL